MTGRFKDLLAAVVTLPSTRQWWYCLIVYGVFIVCVLPIGLLSGFLSLKIAVLSPTECLFLIVYLLLRPALVEELIFRALLLPRDPASVERGRLVLISIVALIVFVASHPLNGWLLRPVAFALFTDPVFLSCAALLGISCTLAYYISKSLWPPVVIHWVTVAVWILLLGGQGLIGTPLHQAQAGLVGR